MTTSSKGINFIKANEDMEVQAYQDSARVWTIGIGHTGGVRKGQRITVDKALALFRSDLKTVENAINKYVTSSINQNQFDALSSFVFNEGVTAFKKSNLLQLVNKNPSNLAIKEEFERWKYITVGAQKIVKEALLNRRKREANLYFTKI